jgi:threonine dehydrogenase-like Zn-dependent dehydrogenase
MEYGYNLATKRPQTALWGGYSQYLYVPHDAIVHKFYKKVDWKEAVLTEPLAVSCRAVKSADVYTGNSVTIFGPGIIGLMTVAAAKTAGAAPIILVGTRDYRLQMGKTLGADYAINIKEKDTIKEVMDITNGIGTDVVFETAGSESAQVLSFKIVRKGGKVILVGFSGGRELTIKPDFDLVEKELTVKGSYLSAQAYKDSIKIIQSGRFPLRQLITHIFSLKDVGKAYDLISKRADNVLKVLLDPWMVN